MPNLLIDKYSLDRECVEQAENYRQAAELFANCVEERDRAELGMDITYAEIARDLRAIALERGDRVTEKAIDSAIMLNPDYIKSRGTYLELKAKTLKADALRKAWEQRKDTLEQLCRLYLAGYFAEVSISQTPASAHTSRSRLNREIEDAIERDKRASIGNALKDAHSQDLPG
jgi:hypothetical protein